MPMSRNKFLKLSPIECFEQVLYIPRGIDILNESVVKRFFFCISSRAGDINYVHETQNPQVQWEQRDSTPNDSFTNLKKWWKKKKSLALSRLFSANENLYHASVLTAQWSLEGAKATGEDTGTVMWQFSAWMSLGNNLQLSSFCREERLTRGSCYMRLLILYLMWMDEH